MNCTKADPFEYLTFELLIKICGYLDNDSLYNLGFVCKSSRNIVLHPFLKLKERLLDDASIEIDSQHHDKSMSKLLKIRRLFPYWCVLWKEIGICWKEKLFIKRAIKCLLIAKKLSKDISYKYYIDANIQWILNNYQESLNCINEALKLSPNNPTYLHFRGFIKCLFNENDYEFFEEYYQIIEINKKQPYNRIFNVYNNIGYCYYMKKEYDKAIAYYTKCIDHFPNHVRALYNRSLSYHDKGDITSSIADIDKVLSINSSLKEVYSCKGWWYFELDMIEEAIESYKQSLPKTYDEIHIILCFLFLLMSNGSIDQIFESLDYIIKRNKNDIIRYYKYLKRKRKNKKIDYFEYDDDPKDLNDMIDDYPMDEKLISEITSTFLRAVCIRGEMKYICGYSREAYKDYKYLLKKTSLDKNNFLFIMMNSKAAARISMVGNKCIEELNQFSTLSQPSYGAYHRSLRNPSNYFNNIEESVYFVSSFIYKYQMLFIHRDDSLSIETILTEIRNEHERPSKFMLYPYVLIGLIRIYTKSDGLNTPKRVMDSFYDSDQKHNLMNLFNFIDETINSLIDDNIDNDSFNESDSDEDEEDDEDDSENEEEENLDEEDDFD